MLYFANYGRLTKMRTMSKDRRRAVVVNFSLDNVGKLIWKKLPVYSHYHKNDIDNMLAGLSVDKVMVINYQHGNTKTNIISVLKKYPKLSFHLNSKFKVLIISNKDSVIALEMVRRILTEELWRHSL